MTAPVILDDGNGPSGEDSWPFSRNAAIGDSTKSFNWLRVTFNPSPRAMAFIA
ncbi:hypothetical protein FHT86_000763 [Rhizobium sp. BK313]|uniref:hypothetical protein n=1 Tax=Rhizobium sp. BK313 TaxID=2587081 RepID=UPI0010E87B95|nr:hypothetical protein [Rhizobium sp. BK313]MBB3452507.1 hypothetical protein [Rhizobium sp. BK313]